MKILRNQKGAIAALTALSMMMVMGMAALVVDAGMMYVTRAQLMNAVDAGALAGVQSLPGTPSDAASIARNYALRHNISQATVTATVGDYNGLTDGKITVTAQQAMNTSFAGFLGIPSVNVTASAEAAVQTFGGGTGVIPFGVEQQTFIRDQIYVLKEGAGDYTDYPSWHHGNFGGLALGGTGADVYEDNIKYGTTIKVSVGDWELTKPGNMTGPTSSGVAYRIGMDPTATYLTVTEGSPRNIIVPIIDSLNVNGRGYVLVVGFAAFFLEGIGGNGVDNYVIGRFRESFVAVGDAGSGTNYGVYTSSLIK